MPNAEPTSSTPPASPGEMHRVGYDGDQDVRCSCGESFGAGDGYTTIEDAEGAAERHAADALRASLLAARRDSERLTAEMEDVRNLIRSGFEANMRDSEILNAVIRIVMPPSERGKEGANG